MGFGRFRKGLVGKGGNVGLGRVGKEGSGGNVVFGMGRDGIVGNAGTGVVACKRFRAATLISMLEKHNAVTIIDNRKQCLKPAILGD